MSSLPDVPAETVPPGELSSPYGPADTIGAANEIGAAQVLQAAALIRTGRRYDLSQVLDDQSPAQMWRFWKHTLVLDRVIPGRALGTNQQSFLEETVAGALHSGTHLDGLGHIGIGPLTYNGIRYSDIVTPSGITRLGIEGVPPLFGRGVLLDVARCRGVQLLGSDDAIGAADLEKAAELAGITIRPGDMVLLHTGWGALWDADPGRYKASEPGLDVSGAAWLTDRRVTVIGADNWAVERVSASPESEMFPVHQHCLTRHGCYLLENVRTNELAADSISEFCCVILPNRLKGASASMVAPLAVI
jgi:kynurenine formamidase